MPLTNFPYGVSSFGIPLIGSGPVITTGRVFFVDFSTGADARSRGRSPDQPLKTLAYAIGLCRAGKGDVIFLMPGHTESVTASAGITLNVDGVRVIGLGEGSTRPTFSFTTSTAAHLLISGNGVTVENCVFVGVLDALVAPIRITGADVTLRNIETRDTPGSAQATDFILASGAVRLCIEGWRHRGDTAAGANSALAIVGGSDISVSHFDIYGNFAVSAIDIRTTATSQLRVHTGYIRTYNSADLCIKDTITGSTGFIGPGLYLMLKDDAANITEAVTGATFVLFDDVYVCNKEGEKAMLINWTASTDA